MQLIKPSYAGIIRIRYKGHPLRDLSAFAPLVFDFTNYKTGNFEFQAVSPHVANMIQLLCKTAIRLKEVVMRLDKYLSDMGAGTRSELKKEIRKSGVIIDGKIIKDPGFIVDEFSHVVFRGSTITYEEFVYYMLNKPAGIISASEDGRESTVVDLISEPKRKDLFPVGRLDRDTEGLLLITNNGTLSHRLLSPKHHVDKVYYARVSGILTDGDIELFRDGLILTDGLECLPADLKILSVSEDEYTSEAEITIREGKFHQVKRMFSSVGAEVIYLKRLSMGPLTLDPGLAPGEYRRLNDDEMASLGL